jgi:hypothetical protein
MSYVHFRTNGITETKIVTFFKIITLEKKNVDFS